MNKLLSVEVKSVQDTDADMSDYGIYSDTAEPWAIVVSEGEYLAVLQAKDMDYEPAQSSRQYTYFKPGETGEVEGSEIYQQYGKVLFARAQDCDNGAWSHIGIQASATIKTESGSDIVQTIQAGGLWGIESDSENSYLVSTAREELDALLSELVALNVDVSQFTQLSNAAIDAAQF